MAENAVEYDRIEICPDCLHLWSAHFDTDGYAIDCNDDRPDGHICLRECRNEDRMSFREVLAINWWDFKAWFRRCPECRHRPDKHDDEMAPRWEHDSTARMLRISQYGCPRCGHGCIEERDAATADPRTPGLSTTPDEGGAS